MISVHTEVDRKRYGRLLARALPVAIRTEEENKRLTAELRALDQRYERLSPEEKELADLITVLIEAFEERQLRLGRPPLRTPASGLAEQGRATEDDGRAAGRTVAGGGGGAGAAAAGGRGALPGEESPGEVDHPDAGAGGGVSSAGAREIPSVRFQVVMSWRGRIPIRVC